MQEVDIMTEKEQATNMIDVYTDLLRIKQAADKEKEVNNLIVKIAEYSGKQAEAAEEVINGIGQISQVVQSNLSTVEKSASASEELSGQAGVLKNLVAKFRLRSR